jgi:hypothetical protein
MPSADVSVRRSASWACSKFDKVAPGLVSNVSYVVNSWDATNAVLHLTMISKLAGSCQFANGKSSCRDGCICWAVTRGQSLFGKKSESCALVASAISLRSARTPPEQRSGSESLESPAEHWPKSVRRCLARLSDNRTGHSGALISLTSAATDSSREHTR